MIVVKDVCKRYRTDHGMGGWILNDVSFTIPQNTNVGLVGKNGAGKSTLLRLIAGTDQPTRGTIERHCNVSWPMGFSGGLQGTLTGRQNAKFVCRIHGHESDISERLAFIEEFAEIGSAFDEPVKTYSSGMAARLKFAFSLAFEFDVYISDELTAVGDVTFKKKAKEAFQDLTGRAGLIMVSHQENTLKEFCTAGIWLNEGHAIWFDDIEDALDAYEESLLADENIRGGNAQTEQNRENKERFEAAKIILQKGIDGVPELVNDEEGRDLIRCAKKMGMELLSIHKIKDRGYQLKPGVDPVLKKYRPNQNYDYIELYDLKSQCVKLND